jgi:hypothetical protein
MSSVEQQKLSAIREAFEEEIAQQKKCAQRAQEAEEPEEEKKHEAQLFREFEKVLSQFYTLFVHRIDRRTLEDRFCLEMIPRADRKAEANHA